MIEIIIYVKYLGTFLNNTTLNLNKLKSTYAYFQLALCEIYSLDSPLKPFQAYSYNNTSCISF